MRRARRISVSAQYAALALRSFCLVFAFFAFKKINIFLGHCHQSVLSAFWTLNLNRFGYPNNPLSSHLVSLSSSPRKSCDFQGQKIYYNLWIQEIHNFLGAENLLGFQRFAKSSFNSEACSCSSIITCLISCSSFQNSYARFFLSLFIASKILL